MNSDDDYLIQTVGMNHLIPALGMKAGEIKVIQGRRQTGKSFVMKWSPAHYDLEETVTIESLRNMAND